MPLNIKILLGVRRRRHDGESQGLSLSDLIYHSKRIGPGPARWTPLPLSCRCHHPQSKSSFTLVFTVSSPQSTHLKQSPSFSLSLENFTYALYQSNPHTCTNKGGVPCCFYLVKCASGSARPYSRYVHVYCSRPFRMPRTVCCG
jgi:hypothetical protein